ncbi:MAG: hypothetical protein APF77_21050 [Clostridia bacterium BRH_c25]|nr:MAG: hypothetical protein APF77_21050 [Clostridia bacterium BRH_c25]
MDKLSKEKKVKTTHLFKEFPHSYVILFVILIIMAIATHIIPAGEFNKIQVGGKTVAEAGSFHFIESSPISFFQLFLAVPLGMQSGATLIFMILLIGGAIRIFDSTGAIKAALLSLLKVIGTDKGSWILGALAVFFASLGAFPAMLESSIPFAPICIAICLALGYDSLVGVAISLLSVVVGWTAGPTNPWTVGVGQSIGELPMFSGFGLRFMLLIVYTAIVIAYVLWYGNKVKSGQRKSLVEGIDVSEYDTYKTTENIEFTMRHKLVLLTLVATIGFILYGTFNWNWGINQMSATYIIGGIVAGVIAGYNGSRISKELIEGGQAIFMAAMAVGLARGISVIMDTSKIGDTIVYYLSLPLEGLPSALTALGMFIIQTILNFFIPSGSGQAMVTLPIMIPLSDLVNVSRQTAILAFQMGDGLSNLCYPTMSVTIAYLALGKVPFNKWIRFALPFIIIAWAVSAAFLVVASGLNW